MPLDVSASSSNFSSSVTYTVTYTAISDSDKTSGYITNVSGGGGYLTANGGTINANTGGGGTISCVHNDYGTIYSHIRLPFVIQKSLSDLGMTSDNLNDFVKLGGSISSISSSGGQGTVAITNYYVTDGSGKLLATGSGANSLPYSVAKLSSFMSSDGNYVLIPFFVEYELMCTKASAHGTGSEHYSFNVSTTFSGSISCSVASESDISNATTPVSDLATQQELEDLNETQESIKDTAEDTNETTHSIFDSISDFFGSFFSNLIGVFVPEDGYFSNWFNRVNTMLTNKLGILYYPFSVIIDIFTRLNTALADNQQNTCPIYFPEVGITIQGVRYVFIESQTVDLINYNIQLGNADTSNSSMFGLTSLIWVVRRFTSLVLVIAFMNMCVAKIKLIMRGSEEG